MRENFAADYARLLEEAGRFHGDICRGIEIGTRMTMAGLDAIDIHDPKGKDRKDIIVFVEIDRCATDAITALTGCRPGKRTMKVLDYGKMAATFVNLRTEQAVRVCMRDKSEQKPDDTMNLADVPDEELFIIDQVTVELRPEDLPGRPVRTCSCAVCGERIMDGREVLVGGKTVCKPCAARATYWRTRTAGAA